MYLPTHKTNLHSPNGFQIQQGFDGSKQSAKFSLKRLRKETLIPKALTLQVKFDCIPNELKRHSRWVVCKDKTPYMSQAVLGRANVTNPHTWSSFAISQTAYEEGGYDGVGFVFNGDGIVGIDLDDCVIDNRPTEAAIEILDEIGCSYVELSQSGRGLHAYGFYKDPPLNGRRGIYKETKIELYSSARFFIVTGNVWRQGNWTTLKGFKQVYDLINNHNLHTKTEEHKAIASVSSVSSVSAVSAVSAVQIPQACIPKRAGQRHDCIFELARYWKAVLPTANDQDLKALLERWWVVAEPNVRTKDFEESWIDLQYAWHNVKFPKGLALARVLQELPSDPPANPGDFLGLIGRRLYHLCQLLERQQWENFGNDVFMLSCRIAGNSLGINYQQANTALRTFVIKGMLEVVQKGTSIKAARYRLVKRYNK